MIKTDEQFEELVKKLEIYAKRDPGGYKFRVGLLAVLGYTYILLVLAVLIGLLAGIVYLVVYSGHGNIGALKLAFFLGVLVFIILKALWVHMTPPTGLPLQESTSPQLFSMLTGIGNSLKAPRFHHVLLTDDFNAGVVQLPRLGVFGWYSNYLLLGLPLMQALTPDQFRAVVAHEMGHLSGNHGRFGGWIYRIRLTWAQLVAQLEATEHGGSWLFSGFFNWYAPYFSAYTFALRRNNEYDADRCAVEVAGKEATAGALMSIPVKARYLHESYWPSVFKRSIEQAEPPSAPFVALGNHLREGVAANDAQKWFVRSLREKTDTDDTHPSLSDRLAAMGYTPPPISNKGDVNVSAIQAAQPLQKTAAEQYLGPSLERLTAQVDSAWLRMVQPQWREKHAEAQTEIKKLENLNFRSESAPLAKDEQWDRARLTAQYGSNMAAIPLLREITTAYPDHTHAHFMTGICLLEERDDSGIACIEQAMKLDRKCIIPAIETVCPYLADQGREDDAKAFLDRGLGILNAVPALGG